MHLTPLDIQQKKFTTKLRGFDPQEVDAFLSLISSELESSNAEAARLRDEVERQTRVIESFQQREDALKETMLTAQKVTEDMKEAAKKEADIIVGRAELDAERLVESAQDRLTELFSDIQELKRQKTQFTMQLRGILKTHEKLIEMGEESAGKSIEENVKVMRKPTTTNNNDAALFPVSKRS